MGRGRRYQGSKVVKLCSAHYNMLRDMHNEMCSLRSSPGCYPIAQPMQGRCPPSGADPFDRVGQSETLYLSSTSPQPRRHPSCNDMAKTCATRIHVKPKEEHSGETEVSLEAKIRQEIQLQHNAQEQEEKIKQMEAAISPEAIEAKIRKEMKRNKEEQEVRIRQLEATNYLAPRPEPQFCHSNNWLVIPHCTNAKVNEDVKRKRQGMVEQPSKEEYFECPPPRDDRRMRKESKFCGENQLLIKGLTTSEIVLLDCVASSDDKPSKVDKGKYDN